MGVSVSKMIGRTYHRNTAVAVEPHAHRRTFATVAVEAGVLEEIVGRLLNHTPMSITGQRYALPSLDALRPAMEVVCRGL